MADLYIEGEENAELVFEDGVEEVNKYSLCLVSRFLSESNINVRVMRSKEMDDGLF